MGRTNTIPIRADPSFVKNFIRDVKIERIKMGKDNPLKPVKTARLTLAFTRLPEAKSIKQRLINADFK